MWLRLRLDIEWFDLARALYSWLTPDRQRTSQGQLEALWSGGENDALACLSVRSGFDLLLQALNLPKGSEVLFSAITIRDMSKIAQFHDLVPVPVDLDGSDFHVDIESLRQAVTPRSRVLVVAHLYGARPDLRELRAIAREHDIFVVEDCAQAWSGKDWRGDEHADASLFSFGVIKTATCLGGAMCRVKDSRVLARMREIQARQPTQSRLNLPLRACKFGCLKALSGKYIFGWVTRISGYCGKSIDGLLRGLTRGFSDHELMLQLRRQPAVGLLRLMEHRIRGYDQTRISRRVENARRIINTLGLAESQPELLDKRHSFWLFPLMNDQPADLVSHLRSHGFDLTQRGSMEVVPPPADRESLFCHRATELLNRTVFLPCYSEIPIEAIDEMCSLIANPKSWNKVVQ